MDLDGDGEYFDDAFLVDTRLRPLPESPGHPGATRSLNRYSVVIPAGTLGPVAVTAAVYYQSFESSVAKKFLGNLADTDSDLSLEPCVLGGLCDGRTPTVEPAVVEGAPPVPMEVKNWVIKITGVGDTTPPQVISKYPASGAASVYDDVVVKAQFSEPVTGVDATKFTLQDSEGALVPAYVDQISDGVWAVFPKQIYLSTGGTYTATLASGICDYNNNCTTAPVSWSFTITSRAGVGTGNTSAPLGFPRLPTPLRTLRV